MSSARLPTAPLVVRLGGLPADCLDAFHSPLVDRLEEVRRLERELTGLREGLVERLYDAIKGRPGTTRRFLLAVKRDCFNGRPLDKHTRSPLWPLAAEVEGLPRLVEGEAELVTLRTSIESDFDAQVLAEAESLRELTKDPVFFCGLAVASPLLAERCRRFRESSGRLGGRRGRRLATSLLRYASRAALKLSPFSTFTSVALAEVSSLDDPLSTTLAPSRSGLRSLVRLRRHLLDRWADLLRRHPPFRHRLEIVLNDSRTHLTDGQVLFLRPSRWALDREQNKLAFVDEALVKVGLGDLATTLEELFESQTWTHGTLVHHLDELLAEAGAGQTLVARLLEIGFLLLPPPWDDDAGHLEATILDTLEGLAPSEELAAFQASIAELVGLQRRLLDSPRPEDSVRRMTELIDETLEAGRPLADLGEATVTNRVTTHDLYQDTWVECADGHPVARLSRAAAEGIVDSLAPIVQLSWVFDHRHEFLATSWHLLEEAGAARELPFLELFDRLRPTFLDFVKFQVAARDGDTWKQTWNPLGLEELDQLAAQRQRLVRGLDALGDDVPGVGRCLSPRRLEDLLAEVPRRFAIPTVGPCAFLQPVSADGSLWMVNRVKEGTGRFASRYTPVMDPAVRHDLQSRWIPRGVVELEGERVELLDIWSLQGDTLNVHHALTPRVLCHPGQRVRHPDQGVVSLGDLWVHRRAHGTLEIRDRQGQRLLPVHLGVGHADYMPTLTKFLCAFGPSEMGAVFPPPWRHRVDGAVVSERTLLGNLVLHRKSWSLAVEPLRSSLRGLGAFAAFEALQRWRVDHGLPERVFAVERVDHEVAWEHYQPQYIDFTSPGFVELVRTLVEAADTSLTFVEQLPEPDHFPVDANGRRRAVEILLDSLAFAPTPPLEKSVDTAVGRMAGAESPPPSQIPSAGIPGSVEAGLCGVGVAEESR